VLHRDVQIVEQLHNDLWFWDLRNGRIILIRHKVQLVKYCLNSIGTKTFKETSVTWSNMEHRVIHNIQLWEPVVQFHYATFLFRFTPDSRPKQRWQGTCLNLNFPNPKTELLGRFLVLPLTHPLTRHINMKIWSIIRKIWKPNLCCASPHSLAHQVYKTHFVSGVKRLRCLGFR